MDTRKHDGAHSSSGRKSDREIQSNNIQSHKSGRVSALKDETGSFHIEPSELHRVYPPTVSGEHKEIPANTPEKADIDGTIRKLQARLEAAHERLPDKETVIADLRDDRDRWRQQATALLADQRPPRGLIARLLGR